MGLIERLIGRTTFIDTAPLIYFIEGHSDYQDDLHAILSPAILDKSTFKHLP